jgi:Protein of unknown function (DUF2911)
MGQTPKRFVPNRVSRLMPTLLRASLLFLTAGFAFGQFGPTTLPPSGNNQRATVTQGIGPVNVTVEYSSPAVHGPDGKDRKGQIWGKLVPYGLTNPGFANNQPDPWRAGANETTVFAVSSDVIIEGQPLPAGRYGLFMIPEHDEWTIIFNKNSSSWGSFFYDASLDVLRVKVKPHAHDYREWLTYEFPVRRPNETTAELQWEDLAVGWNIKADVNEIYMTQIRRELTGSAGFKFDAYMAAAQFCLNANTNLEQGLKWADASISMPFVGQENFDTLSTKALILAKLGRDPEAKTIMDTALHLPSTTALQIHVYGRQLLAAKKNSEAMAIFKYNAERNGDAWPTHVGLARGYAAMGDNKQALEHAEKAVAQAPDPINKKSLEDMVKALSTGQSIQ